MVNKLIKNATFYVVINLSVSCCYQPFVAVRGALALQKAKTQDPQMQVAPEFVQVDFVCLYSPHSSQLGASVQSPMRWQRPCYELAQSDAVAIVHTS